MEKLIDIEDLEIENEFDADYEFDELIKEMNDNYDDIPEVKESRFKNIFRRKSNNEVDLDDIPSVKISKKEKIRNWFNTKKEKHEFNKNVSKEVKRVKKERKEEKRKAGLYTEGELAKSIIKCTLSGLLTCTALAGALVAASSVFTIGLLPTILITTSLVAGYKIMNSLFKGEYQKLKEIKQNYSSNFKPANIETNKKAKKFGFFKRNKKHLSKSKNKEVKIDDIIIEDLDDIEEEIIEEEKQEVIEEPKQEETIIKNLQVNNTKVNNVKLTREQKIAKVKEECKLGYIKNNNLTVYFVSIPKEEITLQRFIKNEYKKQNPEEKIQTLDINNKKVLILANKPKIK